MQESRNPDRPSPPAAPRSSVDDELRQDKHRLILRLNDSLNIQKSMGSYQPDHRLLPREPSDGADHSADCSPPLIDQIAEKNSNAPGAGNSTYELLIPL